MSAVASTVWVTRRVRVASLVNSSNDHHHSSGFGVKPPPHFATPHLIPLKKNSGAACTPSSPLIPSEWLSSVPQEPIADLKLAISAKIQEKSVSQDEAEKQLEALNKDVFWSKYSTLTELAAVEAKSDIIKIIFTFQFIGKKSVYVLSQLARKIIANKHVYSSEELASIIHAFAQLGFLEEAFCMQLSEYLIPKLGNTDSQSFAWIADGFATTRCFHSEFVETVLREIPKKSEQMNVSQVSLVLSSLARLNVRDESVFKKLGNRLIALTNVFGDQDSMFVIPEDTETNTACNARDVTLTAYAFAKMKIEPSHKLTETIVSLSKQLIRDFTAKELQMLMTALDRFDLQEQELFTAVSAQAQRRIAQFSADTLVHLLRAMCNRAAIDEALTTRVICQLPRIINNIKAPDLVALLKVFADMDLKSQTAVAAIKAPLVSKAGQLSSSDWISVLDSTSRIADQETVSEVLDAFTLVNASPANYRSTTNIINATVISRMKNSQFVSLLSVIAGIKNIPVSLVSILENEMSRRSWAAGDASDAYCSLVKMNMHDNPKFETVMRSLLADALETRISAS
jgi:hypothetical protein